MLHVPAVDVGAIWPDHRLVITDTFYDAPKPHEDNRKGIHTTELGEMIVLCNIRILKTAQ